MSSVENTIYMKLIGEGTDVWRPVTARHLDGVRYKILDAMPEDEKWEFAAGAIVKVAPKKFADGHEGLVVIAQENSAE